MGFSDFSMKLVEMKHIRHEKIQEEETLIVFGISKKACQFTRQYYHQAKASNEAKGMYLPVARTQRRLLTPLPV